MHEVDWAPALLMLVLAAAFGVGFLAWSQGAKSELEQKKGKGRGKGKGKKGRGPAGRPEVAAPGEALEISTGLADLEARRDSLLYRLQEIVDTADDEHAEALEQEQRELELETARVLREIDRLRGQRAVPQGRPERVERTPAVAAATAAPRTAVRGFLWGVGTMAAVAMVMVLLLQTMVERPEGELVTGSLPAFGEGMGAPQGGPAGGPDGDIRRLAEAVERRPDDLEARLDLSRALLMRQEMMEVFRHTEVVLQEDPDNPRALSYQAMVRLAMGEAETAEEMLFRALAREPDLLLGWVHLGFVYQSMDRPDEARMVLEEALHRHPERAGMIHQLLAMVDGQR